MIFNENICHVSFTDDVNMVENVYKWWDIEAYECVTMEACQWNEQSR